MVAAKKTVPSNAAMSRRRRETILQCRASNRLRHIVKILIRHNTTISPADGEKWSEMIDSTHKNISNEDHAKRILVSCLGESGIDAVFFTKKGTDIEAQISDFDLDTVSTWYICILIAYLTNSGTLDWFAARCQAWQILRQIKSGA